MHYVWSVFNMQYLNELYIKWENNFYRRIISVWLKSDLSLALVYKQEQIYKQKQSEMIKIWHLTCSC
jgi:hypothetical protein